MEFIDTLLGSDNIAYLVFAIVAIIVAFMLIKKVASCLFKTVIFVILLALMAYIYMNYIQEPESEAASLQVETTK